nr:hypothetical protein [Pseudomonadota bacterium]
MRRPLRIAAAAFLLALAACSFVYRIRAVFVGGTITFVSDHAARGEPWCLHRFAIIGEDGRSRWEIEWTGNRGAEPCRDFP